MVSKVCCCCSATTDLHLDHEVMQIYKDFLDNKVKDTVIECFCSMCREKLIDIENFKKICLKTLRALEMLPFTQDDHQSNDPAKLGSNKRKLRKPETFSRGALEHIEVENYQCKKCTQKFISQEKFQNHIIDVCCKDLKNDELCQDILRGEHSTLNESQKSSFCTHCEEEVFDYTTHLTTVHATTMTDNRLECKECLAIIAQKFNFVTHFRKFHKRFPAPEQCPHCVEKFLLCGEYNRHILSHKDANNSKLFTCHYCQKAYINKQMLRFHMINHHTSRRCCPFCSQIFDAAEYKVHVADERAKRKKENFVCDICGFSTKHQRYLKSHITRLHSTESATCDECGRVCKTALNLRDHKLNMHRERKALCTICGCKFRNQSFLKTHIDRSHTDEKVQCKECGKEMHPSMMKRHIFFKHSTVRPFECRVCSMTFKAKSGLHKHFHKHTGTRPFNCNQCCQGYYNRELLQKHYGQAHGVTYTSAEMKKLSKRTPSSLEETSKK